MKVQKIDQPASIEKLEPWGSVEGLPDTPTIQLSGLQKIIPGKENVDTGIFECTAGSYRRSVKQAEIMHFLSGEGSFTPDGEATLTFKPGDSFFFEENTQGTWVIETQMRKLYVIFDAA
ncbi:cupin domain-containing protein [Pantoea sp. T14]|jgi:uncharacterized cupin superfamily protein|uniref:cupin domain-containing protein n=1 Tax=Pantoea sp. T14 TaxID=3085685 RepID=UPI002FCC1D72